MGTFSIGVPGLFLALAPSTELIRPGFLRRVLRFSVPAGVLAAVASFFVYEIAPPPRGGHPARGPHGGHVHPVGGGGW